MPSPDSSMLYSKRLRSGTSANSKHFSFGTFAIFFSDLFVSSFCSEIDFESSPPEHIETKNIKTITKKP